MIRYAGNFVFLAAGLAASSPAWAQEAVDPYSLSPEQLFQATIISASRTPEDVWQAPTAAYVITAADIQQAGVTSIPEALRLAPGVDVARINSSGWAISIRGFNSELANKLLVLIDGREVYDPLFSGVYWDVQDMPLEDIERIEVIRGPGASLWGANAVNGVINIITKRAGDTQGGLISVTAGDPGNTTFDARYGGTLGSTTHWRVYGRWFDRDGQKTLTDADDNSDWMSWRSGFRIDSAPNAHETLTLQGDIYHSETGQLRDVGMLTAPFSIVESEDITAEGGNVLARWTRETGNGGRLTAQSYVDLTRRDQLTLGDRRTTFDVDAQYEFPHWRRQSIVAGFRYRTTNDDIRQTPIITSSSSSHSEQLFSTFFQDQIALSPAWRLTVGSKFDFNDFTGFEIQPTARLQWTGEKSMIWASISRAVRSPSELERDFDVVTGVIPPNIFIPAPVSVELRPNDVFESEELVAYEAGYRRQWTSTLATDLAIFRNVYDGLATNSLLAAQISLTPAPHFILPIETTNSTSARTEGAELEVSWRAADNLNVSLGYAFLNMNLRGPPPSVAIAAEAAEDQSPRNLANLAVQWEPSRNLQLDLNVYYVDKLPGFQINSHVRTDLRAGYRLSEHVELELVGQDVFDESYREFGSPASSNAASIQRTVFGRLTWRS